jgi:hypothetical protein
MPNHTLHFDRVRGEWREIRNAADFCEFLKNNPYSIMGPHKNNQVTYKEPKQK